MASKSRKMITDLIPITGYDQDLSCYSMKEGYMDLLQIRSKDLVTASEDEVEYDILKFCKLYRLYEEDVKLLVMNFPCNTKIQQEYLQRKMNRTTNMIFRENLQRQIDELVWLEKNNTTREFYLMIFAKTLEELDENRRLLKSTLHTGRDGLIETIDDEKKHKILYRLNNKCSQVA